MHKAAMTITVALVVEIRNRTAMTITVVLAVRMRHKRANEIKVIMETVPENLLTAGGDLFLPALVRLLEWEISGCFLPEFLSMAAVPF